MSAIYFVVDSDARKEIEGVRGNRDVTVQGYVGSREGSRKVVEVRVRKGEDGKFRVEAWFNREDAEVTIY